jgi:hypothetical protein
MPNLSNDKSLANNTLYRHLLGGVSEKRAVPGNFGDSDIKTACEPGCKELR